MTSVIDMQYLLDEATRWASDLFFDYKPSTIVNNYRNEAKAVWDADPKHTNYALNPLRNGNNDALDAFEHIFTSIKMTKLVGASTALVLGHANETSRNGWPFSSAEPDRTEAQWTFGTTGWAVVLRASSLIMRQMRKLLTSSLLPLTRVWQ